MKKSLALLLASAFLVFALTACGGDKKEDGVNGSDTPTTEDSMDDPDSSVTDDILDGTGKTNGDRDTADDGLRPPITALPRLSPVMTPPRTTTLPIRTAPCPVRTLTLGAIAPGSAPATTRCWKMPKSTTATET